VGQGKLTLIQMDYDFAGKISATIQTYKPGSTTATSPINSKALRVTAENSASVGWLKNLPLRTAAATDSGSFLMGGLFPFSTAYSTFTGACHYSNPTFDSANSGYYGTYPGSTAVTPGGTANIFVRQPPLNVQMTKDRNSTSPPADGMKVIATPVQASGDSCVEPSITLQTWTTTGTGGGAGTVGRATYTETSTSTTQVDAGVPFGYYKLCFQRGSSTIRYTVWPTDYPGNGTSYDNTDPLGRSKVSIDASSTNTSGPWHSGSCPVTP
jgi:hypothetical protein